jgi:hypothetical protein
LEAATVLCGMKRLSGACALLLGLAACHSQTSPPATTGAARPLAPGEAAPTPTVTDSPGAAYRVYRGLLPGQADSITLHLVTAPQPRYDTHGPNSQGSYYGTDGHPYQLASQPSASDSLVLNDYSPEHGIGPNGQAPKWRLKRQPDGSLLGTVGTQAVRLRLSKLGTDISFAVRCFTDSLAAYPDQAATSPKARIYVQAFVPTGGPATVRERLQAGILRTLRGDTLDSAPAVALPALFRQQRDTLFAGYRTDVAEILKNTEPDERPSATLNYDEQATTQVLYQAGDLLSLGFFNYTYSGGAHGMNTTTAASYDLRTGRHLRYDDIFLPAAQAQLPALLAQAVRPLVGLKPNEPLSQTLFVTKMPVTHNVFLTAGGVEFIYQPYDIAAYAQGEVRVFLPLAQVRPLLRDGLPLPGNTVAKR